MAWWKTSLAALGYGQVTTYVQSGNAVVDAPRAKADTVARDVGNAIGEGLGLTIAVAVRTATDLDGIVSSNPFASRSASGTQVHVAFLDHAPSKDDIERIDAGRSPGDEVVVTGREAFLFLPNGAGRSKLTNDYLERTLRVTATARNWNTVQRLRDLTAETSTLRRSAR
jgi:uncharacterized protein (DUF1697 family)